MLYADLFSMLAGADTKLAEMKFLKKTDSEKLNNTI